MPRTTLCAISAALLLVAGCSSAGDDAPAGGAGSTAPATSATSGQGSALSPVTPAEDSVSVVHGDVALAVPAGWQITSQGEDAGLVQTSVSGEDPRMILDVVSVPTSETDAQAALEETRAQGEPTDEQAVELAPLTTSGAATLVQLTREQEGTIASVWALVFEHQAGSTYVVTLLGLQEDFDEGLAREILGSVRDA